MKPLIAAILILLFAYSAHAQGTVVGTQYVSKRWMITAGTGYSTWQGVAQNGIKLGGLYFIPSGTPPEGGWPVIIFFHGVGEKGGYNSGTLPKCDTLQLAGGAYNDASVDALFNTTPFSQLKLTSGRLVNQTYYDGLRNITTKVAWIAVQCWGDDQTASAWGWFLWPPVYRAETVKWIKTFWKGKLDPRRIYYTGLSYGGGGCEEASQDSAFINQMAGGAWNCAGYFTGTNMGVVARSGCRLRIFSAVNDGVALPIHSTNFQVQLLARPDKLIMPEFFQFTEGDAQTNHDIWGRMYDPAKWGITYNLTNGDTYNTNKQGNIVEWFLLGVNDPKAPRRPVGL